MRNAVLLILPLLLLSGCSQNTTGVNNTVNSSQYSSGQFNVILISVDSLRYDHLRMFGYERDTAPALEKFAQEGVSFDSYITQAYLTPISEMALHTGQYPTSSGAVSFDTVLPEDKTTLAQILKIYGYRTAAIGTSPEFENHPALRKSFEKGFDTYKISDARIGSDIDTSTSTIKEWISENGTKFFLWLPIGSIHWPYGNFKPTDKYGKFLDPDYQGFFYNKDPLNWNELGKIYQKQYYVFDGDKPTGEKKPLTDDDFAWMVDQYDGNILRFDDWLEEFLDALDELGMRNNTIIVIASEHGEDFGEHGYIAHYDIFDTQIRTPLIIVAPGFPKNVTISDQVQSIDVLPTILDMLAISKHHQIQGSSVLPLVNGSVTSFNEHVFIERIPLWEHVISRGATTLYPYKEFYELDKESHFKDVAVRTKEWKLIYRQSRDIQQNYSWWGYLTETLPTIEEYELYDLRNDPMETTNVYDRYPKVAGALKELLIEWLQKEERNSAGMALDYRQDYF